MQHFSVTFRPDDKQISIHQGATLLEAAGQAGVILNTSCGGKGICGKCKVSLHRDKPSDPAGEVLACQYRIQSDIVVDVPLDSKLFELRILTGGIDKETGLQPEITPDTRCKKGRTLGLAVDIGTTTVVAKLIDLSDGRCIAEAGAVNPQIRYGDDVISRICYAEAAPELAELNHLIIDCLNKLTAKLCKHACADSSDIYNACVVGNTAMNHIFLKLPITQLGRSPYKAFSVDAYDIPAAKTGLKINPVANVHTVENIAGFVGSDTTAVAVAVDIGSAKEGTLVIDIGTNGEVVLAAAGKLYAASCAAGPAFEGARISCGSRAVKGAIEAVIINGDDIGLDIIGNRPPASICGSGIIDAVAVLLDLGIIDSTGRFAELSKLQKHLSAAIVSRVIEKDGQPAFVLALAKNSKATDVILTQQDVRQIQLAKAAIRTGVRLLQNKAGLKDLDIKQILLAGAFGNYIRRESALRIGLLPAVPPEHIHFVGNAACSGAQMILLSSRLRQQASKLARSIEYVEIAHEKDFVEVFADSMLF